MGREDVGKTYGENLWDLTGFWSGDFGESEGREPGRKGEEAAVEVLTMAASRAGL